MIEHEAKILDIDEQNMRSKLEALGARKILDAVTYIEGYDFVDGLTTPGGLTVEERFTEIAERVFSLGDGKNMFDQGAYLRLREEGEKNELIFKQKVGKTEGVKSEIEISVPIEKSEWQEVAAQLSVWGLERIVIQEKRRVSYVYKPYRYDIDTWPGVPTYMEVEAPTQEEVMAALALVGIARNQAMSLTAAEVFKLYGVQNPRHLTFGESKT